MVELDSISKEAVNEVIKIKGKRRSSASDLKAMVMFLNRATCLFAGHRVGPWFKTTAGAVAQHSFADGYQCYRCGILLSVYDENDRLNKVAKFKLAPAPKET